MTMQTVYLYDPTTGEYIGTYDAQESPLEPGEIIAPLDSTPTPPPSLGENKIAIFKVGAWSIEDAPQAAPPAVETPDDVRSRYEAAAQSWLDATARAWGYDSVISAASYATSGVAQYKADAQALIGWRDALWQAAYTIDVSVKNGQAAPATAADFLAMLPAAPARPTA
jgi:hypothetical protein